MRVFHTGFSIISKPDLAVGRKNADFGQGFYLSDSEDFSKRWARERIGMEPILNHYELALDGLKVKQFSRNEEWFQYIYMNRAGAKDGMSGFDVISGPIANDTLYDTWGILTSGLLEPGIALQLLQMGGEYRQIVLKSEQALKQLTFLFAERISREEIQSYREIVRKEEQSHQAMIRESIGDFLNTIDS